VAGIILAVAVVMAVVEGIVNLLVVVATGPVVREPTKAAQTGKRKTNAQR
jgi:hypothetical protein